MDDENNWNQQVVGAVKRRRDQDSAMIWGSKPGDGDHGSD